MAVIRDHLASKGLGLFNDLQNEHSVVGNFPIIVMLRDFGTPAQKDKFITGQLELQDPHHLRPDRAQPRLRRHPHGDQGRARVRNGVAGWRINGEKMWTTGMHVATHCALFARTSGKPAMPRASPASWTPTDTPGVKIEEYLWTFNMPTDHPRVSFTNVWVPADAMFGEEGRGLPLAQSFVHENRIRQAASSLGAAAFCVNESVRYARERKPFGEELARNQGIQFPLVELATQVRDAAPADPQDRLGDGPDAPPRGGEEAVSDKVSMCNYWANRLVCEAADRAMQVHGGIGYSRHKPFEHIYRHHRRYRITEGLGRDPDAQGGRLPVRVHGAEQVLTVPCRVFRTPAAQSAPHYVMTRHYHHPSTFIVNKALFDGMKPDVRAKLLKALPDANWARKQVADTEGPKMKEFVAKGGFVHQLTDAQREAWAAVIRPGQAEMVQAIGGKAQEVMDALNNGKKAWAEKFGKK
jgi:acyl-CoA dehydrogenase